MSTASSPVDALSVLLAHGRWATDNLAQACDAAEPASAVRLSRRCSMLGAPTSAVLVHLLTHGAHHRAPALNVLRHLGVAPLRKSSMLEWMLVTGAAISGTA